MPGPPWPPPTSTSATYTLHCHCGAIRYRMTLSPPLLRSQNPSPEDPIYIPKLCQCSHCLRHGTIACHPKATNVEFTQGLDDRAEYRSAGKQNPHWFCRQCGSSLGTDLAQGATKMLPPEERRVMLNLRMLAGVGLEDLTTERSEVMRDAGPEYVID